MRPFQMFLFTIFLSQICYFKMAAILNLNYFLDIFIFKMTAKFVVIVVKNANKFSFNFQVLSSLVQHSF